MYQDYQQYKIFIYHTPEEKPLLGWAKTFWLLKTAHPIVTIEIPDSLSIDQPIDPKQWLQNFLSLHHNMPGIFTPPTLRPHFDIDLVIDTHRTNRFAQLKNGSLCICQLLPDHNQFNEVSISQVFEDLSSQEDLKLIHEEIDLIRNKLLMNV
jgi:hypothetical protein